MHLVVVTSAIFLERKNKSFQIITGGGGAKLHN